MIYTFYSFKGGVGRSMALANIAEIFYRQGKRVVMIDWDLEAPGLESYFFKTREELEKVRSQPGLIDFLTSYKSIFPKLGIERLTNPDNIAEDISNDILSPLSTEITSAVINRAEIVNIINDRLQLLSDNNIENLAQEITDEIVRGKSKDKIATLLKNHIRFGNKEYDALLDIFRKHIPSFLPLLQSVRAKVDDNGKKSGLWFLSAGWRSGEQLEKYAEQVLDFDWNEFYEVYQGKLFFEWMRMELNSFADIILIDSRTGVTEMGGVCTKQLADVAVLFAAPNYQNIHGVIDVARSLVKYKRKNETDAKLVIIPARLDVSELARRNEFQSYFETLIKELLGERYANEFWQLGIPYIPYYAYSDDVIIGATAAGNEKGAPVKADELENAYIRIAEYLSGEAVHLNQEFAENKSINPYVGLRPFNIKESEHYYGRNEQIAKMLEILDQRRSLIVTGPPGSGKTSALRAGLIPALSKNEQQVIIYLKPSQDPFFNLAAALLNAANTEKSVQTNEPDIRNTAYYLSEWQYPITRILSSIFGSAVKQVVFIFDEIEDLTLHATSPQSVVGNRFIHRVQEWLQESRDVSVVLAIRSDYLPSLMSILDFPDVTRSVLHIGQLTDNDLYQLIVQPATKANLHIEEGLPERIITDIKQSPAKLPIVQFILNELWKRKEGNTLTHAAYNKMGLIEGMLRMVAENTCKVLPMADLEAARPLLTSLVNVDSGTRRQLILTAADQELEAGLKPFVDAGLVAVTYDSLNNVKIVELSHDLLIQAWPQLKDWLDKDRPFLTWREKIRKSFDVWKVAGKKNNFLLQKNDLIEAQKWLSEREKELTAEERKFISKSEGYVKARGRGKLILPIAICLIALLPPGINYFVQLQKERKIKKQFFAALSSIDTLSGQVRLNSICQLSKFDNRYNDSVISELKDSLFKQCLLIDVTVAQTQPVIDTLNYSIDSLTKKLTPKTEANANKVDSIEDKINQTNEQIKKEINEFEKKKLIDSNARLTEARNSIILNDSVLKKAYPYSIKIENEINKQSSVINQTITAPDNNTRGLEYQQTSWFKKGYYLQFEQVKILLTDLTSTSMTVNICETEERGKCTVTLVQSKQVDLDKPITFNSSKNDYRFILKLNRIGSAGRNPFTKAAYTTLEKYKIQQASNNPN